jgi:hypothetical protein
LDAHNSFDHPIRVRPVDFKDVTTTDGGASIRLPPRSVIVLEMRTS